MKKLFVYFLLIFSNCLFAKTYYSEHHDPYFIISFHGDDISEQDEPKIRILESKYLSSRGFGEGAKLVRHRIKHELKSLGVTVEIFESPYYDRPGKVYHPPEFHHYSQTPRK